MENENNEKLTPFYKGLYKSCRAQLNRVLAFYKKSDKYKSECAEIRQALQVINDDNINCVYDLAMLVKTVLLDPRFDPLITEMEEEQTKQRKKEQAERENEKLIKKVAWLLTLMN